LCFRRIRYLSSMAKQESVDTKFVAAAMKRVMSLVKKLPKDLRLPEAGIRAAALGGRPAVRSKSKAAKGAPVVYGGDLFISGSLDIGCIFIVLGDLEVEGVIEALCDEATLIVGGSIKARGVNCTDNIYAAGSIAADVVFVETCGKLGADKGTVAELVILEDADVKPFGKLTAKDKVVLTYPKPAGFERLKTLLAPKAFGFVSGQENLYDYSNLFGALRRGKPWRSSSSSSSAAAAKRRSPSAASKRGAARYFELVDGSSKKFWEITLDGKSFTTRYGRLGTAGQATKKSYASPDLAKAEAEKLLREKTKKGYVEK
jgi:predicted DNA-binding WGR domain protein